MSSKITMFLLLGTLGVFGQSKEAIIGNYLNKKAGTARQSTDLTDWKISSDTQLSDGKTTCCYVVQKYKGIEINQSLTNFVISNNEVKDVEDHFFTDLAEKTNTTTPKWSAQQALGIAFDKLSLPKSNLVSTSKVVDNTWKFENQLDKEQPLEAKLVFQPTKNKTLRLAWNLTISNPNDSQLWNVCIDAITGEVLSKTNLTRSCSFDKHGANCFLDNAMSLLPKPVHYKIYHSPKPAFVAGASYKVIPYNYTSPDHSDFQLISNPANATASPYGWHDTDGVAGNEYTITRGNNVWAKDDWYSTNTSSGSSPDGTSSLTFNYNYGGTNTDATTYLNLAATNLFYMNNMMHDVWHFYGFDEASGNFQNKNYSNASGGFDFVYADAQDGAKKSPKNLNNANFTTPADGSKPRMQMFIWTKGPSIKPLIISQPAELAGDWTAIDNAFEPGHVKIPVAPNAIESDLVLYKDATGGTNLACGDASNKADLANKIVVIRRGTCTFAAKVKKAQDAGALAVIIVNNVSGGVTMSGEDATITIPAISVSDEVGSPIINALLTKTVHAKLQLDANAFVNTDGDLDNGIIAHEYGHGISNRLVGGKANVDCLNNNDQMGEGWSDWIALMMQLKPGDGQFDKKGIGTFVSSQSITGGGIRQYPYTPDMSVNPLTYKSTNYYQYLDEQGVEQTSEHAVGTVWATMLWDLTWAYINKYGYDSNIYTGTKGNNKVMKIVLDAMKLTTCSPTFVDARNAIIKADQNATNGKDFCMIWEVFARRGLGLYANAGDPNIGNDQVEDFTTPSPSPNCTTLAIDDAPSIETKVIVSPNPSKGVIQVQLPENINKPTLSIYSLNGNLLFSQTLEQNNQSINLSHLAKGTYLIQIESANYQFSQKLILQ